jgi:short-subunit dehydrogenase
VTSPLAGKTALITGGASGIGREFAKALAGKGVAVFLVSRNDEALRRQAEEIRADGGQADCHACDLNLLPSLYDLIDIVLARFKKLDILVNNAGVGARGPLLGTERELIQEAIDLNLRAPIYLTQAALPALLRSAPSEIVNVASVYGLHAAAEATVYCATKFGLVGFSRALSLELRPAGIRVTTLCPGSVDTRQFERFEVAGPQESRMAPRMVARELVHALETPHEVIHGEISFHHR